MSYVGFVGELIKIGGPIGWDDRDDGDKLSYGVMSCQYDGHNYDVYFNIEDERIPHVDDDDPTSEVDYDLFELQLSDVERVEDKNGDNVEEKFREIYKMPKKELPLMLNSGLVYDRIVTELLQAQ